MYIYLYFLIMQNKALFFKNLYLILDLIFLDKKSKQDS